MRLIAKGATIRGSIYLHNGKNIRLIYAANECLSAVKAKFSDEPPNFPVVDITICAGGRNDQSPPDIVRGEIESDTVRSGLSGEWVIDEMYFGGEEGIES